MRQWEWNHVHLTVRHYSRKNCKKKKARQPSKTEDQASKKSVHMPTYLLPLALIAFKVGCHIKSSMHCLKVAITIEPLPNLAAFAAADNSPYQVPRICFTTDSFVIDIDTNALVTMGNFPDQFEDLMLNKDEDNTEVEGIKGGLAIKGTGTFNCHIEDGEGAVHHVKIPNSKYILELKICLLLPYYWVQEAQGKYPLPRETRTEEDDEALVLIWKQGKRRQTIPFHPLTNTPSFKTASALHTYHAFAHGSQDDSILSAKLIRIAPETSSF
jgi:hypothetical protein